ncbi:MAG: protein phosphatase 2C domain-containing protein, partial [Armatimonadetes bacterium]|nr:protein phosphatase 2C domain-containing protein [Armatimonadota bacterium]
MHLRDGTARDDAFAIRSAGRWLAVAVADGAGSRPRSRYGASFAVASLCEHMLRAALGIVPEQPSAEGKGSPPLEEAPEPKAPELALARPRLWLPWRRTTARSAHPSPAPSPPQHRPEPDGVPGFAEPPTATPRD